MPGHDIIVIGSSAGGLKALTAIVSQLPASLDAAIFIVQHIAPDHPSFLPQILSDTGSLPAGHPVDGEKIHKGRIYVAPPDHHLMLGRGRIKLNRGPRENRFRPGIDTLFRSAARVYGPRVIGVVLTGHLDDGTVGLQAIKKRGGVAVVQDPREAEYPSMPSNAVRYVKVDCYLPLAEIPAFLVGKVAEPAGPDPGDENASREMEIEAKVAEQKMNTAQYINGVESIGTRTTYTCPACNGTLWQVGEEEPLRFRCHVGHTFTAEGLLTEQTRTLENALWSAVRLMEEKVNFSRQMAERMRTSNLMHAAAHYEEYADNLDREVVIVRQWVVNGAATRYVSTAKEEEEESEDEEG